MPGPILVPHEMEAVSMVYGCTMVTGYSPLVTVHVTVGTANSLIGLINANRLSIPMLFPAGRAPLPGKYPPSLRGQAPAGLLDVGHVDVGLHD